MEKLKIVHVYKSFNVYNGLIEILTILAQNYDRDKYELGVCVNEYQKNSFGDKFESLGGKIFNLNIPQKIYNEPKGVIALYNFFRSYKPHIVQTHVLKANFFGTIAARMAKVPVVIATEMTLKDTAPSSVRRIRDKLVQPFAGYFIKNCDKFVVTSNFIKSEWVRAGKDSRFEVIYPPFNLEKYDLAVRMPRVQTKFPGKRIGFVGRLSEEKSIDFLLESMVRVHKSDPEADLTIVGTGPMEQQLKNYCTKLELDGCVHFAGYKSNSFEALKEMDLFVLSSRTEGCPIVILEAMAMGLPVVATNVGGNPELVVNNETGFLVPHGDSNKMAQAILTLTSDRDRARNLGQNGRKMAFTKFHPASFTDKFQTLYQKIYTTKNNNNLGK